ncbi:MAG: hypothetical protein ACR2PT_02360 [Endozoicomonas sp.]
MKQHKIQAKDLKASDRNSDKLVTSDRVPQDLKPFPKVASSIPQNLLEDRLCFVRGYN